MAGRFATPWVPRVTYAAAGTGVAPWLISGSHRSGFHLAHARIDVDVQVLLPLLRLGELVGQHLDLATDLGDVGLDAFEIAQQVEAQLLALLLERHHARVERLGEAVEARLRGRDGLARLLVVEHARVRLLKRESEHQEGGLEADAAHPCRAEARPTWLSI